MDTLPELITPLGILILIIIVYLITFKSRNWSKFTWWLFISGLVVLAIAASLHVFLCKYTFGEWACLTKRVFYISGTIITITGLAGWARLSINKIDEFELKSRTDLLTGLLNRDGIINYFHKMLHHQDAFVLIMSDLDGTKEVNDTKGHLMGDLFIVEAANEINKFFGPKSVTGRYGGDEFITIITDEDCPFFEERFIDLKKALQKIANKMEINSNVGISMGCARYPEDGVFFDQLLHIADRRMYHDKAKNKHLNGAV